MRICAFVALWAGTRTQRGTAGILFVLAITGVIFQVGAELRDKQRLQDRVRRVKEANKALEKAK